MSLNNINKAGEILTVGGIKVLNQGYNKNQLIQTKVLLNTLSMARTHETRIDDITSDSVVTPIEKVDLRRINDEINDQQAVLYSQFSDYVLTANTAWTEYNTAYTNLHDLLALILADPTTNYELGAEDDLPGLFDTYYTKKTAASEALSTFLQNTIAKVSQFGIQLNVDSFDGTSNSEDGSIYVHGFDGSGDAADVDGNIYYLGARIDITKGKHVTGFTDKRGYIYLTIATGAVGTCYYHAGSNEFRTSADAAINETDNLVIGEFTASSGVIGPATVYNTATTFGDVKNNKFMDLLATAAGSDDFNNMITNLGIQFFNNLAASNAFITNLLASNLKVGNGDTSAGFMFRADYDNGDPETGTPRFDVYHGGKLVFKINPTTVDIFFGDYEAGNGGLKWDNSANQIVSKDNKLKINADGTIEATDGTFNGTVTAGSGSDIDYSNVSGTKPPTNADNTKNFIASGVAFQTANGKFKVLSDGSIEAVNGKFSGDISGSTGSFSGDISGASGTFGGNIASSNVSLPWNGSLYFTGYTAGTNDISDVLSESPTGAEYDKQNFADGFQVAIQGSVRIRFTYVNYNDLGDSGSQTCYAYPIVYKNGTMQNATKYTEVYGDPYASGKIIASASYSPPTYTSLDLDVSVNPKDNLTFAFYGEQATGNSLQVKIRVSQTLPKLQEFLAIRKI